MKRDSLQDLPGSAAAQLATQVGEDINEHLKKTGWMQRIHWGWLYAIIAGSWALDFVVNTIFHMLTVFGHALDTLLGPIDEALIAVLPYFAARELIRRGVCWWGERKARKAAEAAQIEESEEVDRHNQAAQA